MGEENESVVLSILRSINVYEDETNTAEHRLVLAEEDQEKTDDFVWMSREQIQNEAALPTAFRQFWEEIDYV